MRQTPIEEFVRVHKQVQAAALLGLSQGAISKMLRAGRRVTVIEHEDGRVLAVEEKVVAGRGGGVREH
jgi:predicted transcriptional regulator